MDNKVILITGASAGVGLETAVFLAERGFRVYATMRDLRRREMLDAEAARRSVKLRVLQLDVTDSKSISHAVEEIIAETGQIYSLINNAGMYLRGYFEDVSDEEIRHVFETNVFGAMEVTRAVLPHMRHVRKGRIITVSSVAGKSGALTASIYCASKFALEGFFESLMQELASWNIHVSIIEPAILKSDKWATDYCSAMGALNPDSAYYTWYTGAKKLMDMVARSSSTVNMDVAKAIYKALQARHPRLRYMVGRRARLMFALRRYVPGDLIQRIYFNESIRRVTGSSHF